MSSQYLFSDELLISLYDISLSNQGFNPSEINQFLENAKKGITKTIMQISSNVSNKTIALEAVIETTIQWSHLLQTTNKIMRRANEKGLKNDAKEIEKSKQLLGKVFFFFFCILLPPKV